MNQLLTVPFIDAMIHYYCETMHVKAIITDKNKTLLLKRALLFELASLYNRRMAYLNSLQRFKNKPCIDNMSTSLMTVRKSYLDKFRSLRDNYKPIMITNDVTSLEDIKNQYIAYQNRIDIFTI